MARGAATVQARRASRPVKQTKNAVKSSKRASTSKSSRKPKRAKVESEQEDSSDVDDLANDAQAMADNEDQGEVDRLRFLSKAKIPTVGDSRAQKKEKERIQAEKRRQRQALEALRREREQEQDAMSDASTDMEGASESEEDIENNPYASLDDDLGDESDEEVSQIDSSPNTSDLEETYLQHAAKRSKREEKAMEKERESLAHRRLPIRMEDGQMEYDDDQDQLAQDAEPSRVVFHESDEDSEEEQRSSHSSHIASSAVHSTRFGLRAPYEIIVEAQSSNPATVAKGLALAREQIAKLASQIVGDPEMGLHWLKRLLVFAQTRAEAPPGVQGKPRVQIHVYIRQLALLSLLAVFVDIIPGYRIRSLSEQEEKDKVSQEVARRREWEQGLVRVYREFLEVCEKEVRSATPLAPVALRTFCTLLTRASHFNYRKNLLAVVIAQLSRKAWTKSSEECYKALVGLLREDNDGEVSLEAVTLFYRMIRERNLAVHANVLDILAHLRLRDELGKGHRTGPMGSASVAKSKPASRHTTSAESRKADPKLVRKGLASHVSKKQAKRNKELREIEEEMREAEAAVNVEERSGNQSETLKLIFALYFRILKTPDIPQQLLAAALEGIVLYAHHVSLDFFNDLIRVLRSQLQAAMTKVEASNEIQTDDLRAAPRHVGMRTALLMIISAMELLKGQGESLEIDLADFYVALYQLLLPLSLSTCFEEEAALPAPAQTPKNRGPTPGLRRWSESAMLFHILHLGFVKVSRQSVYMTIDRTAAILKRLLTAAMQWPTGSALHALQLAHTILARTAVVDPRFESLIDNRDSVRDGQHDPYASIPEGAWVLPSGEAAFELFLLSSSHANSQVREAATVLLNWKR
ncbi:hypothetical protein MPSI1_000092 [Malassezia psittaci]|uniref:Nucleolar complex-associated protein 3 n=1 Tax=Malassezia psittaci TaxID=1821823 RepID=A0AAF0F5Z5_9BASI|nr:hypothetical protein MPSI1_000092 [Malassezia psittaci]